MGSDDAQLRRLQSLHDAASLLHGARGQVNKLEDLVDSGIRDTHQACVSQAVIAEAVALTPGRVCQVISGVQILESWDVSRTSGTDPSQRSRRSGLTSLAL